MKATCTGVTFPVPRFSDFLGLLPCFAMAFSPNSLLSKNFGEAKLEKNGNGLENSKMREKMEGILQQNGRDFRFGERGGENAGEFEIFRGNLALDLFFTYNNGLILGGTFPSLNPPALGCLAQGR